MENQNSQTSSFQTAINNFHVLAEMHARNNENNICVDSQILKYFPADEEDESEEKPFIKHIVPNDDQQRNIEYSIRTLKEWGFRILKPLQKTNLEMYEEI